MTDEWHITIEQRYLNNEAGAGARQKERELAGEKRAVRRFLDRVFDPRTEDRSWRRGAEGEERVAAQLASLGEEWAVVHDLTIGRKGANLDHLVIGPAGVFALNTKNLTGKLTVYEHAILQNGHKTAFVPAALREVRTVQERLSAAASREVRAWSVLVVMGCQIEVRKPLANLTLVGAWNLPGWLRALPGGVLSPGEVITLERLARTPGTWLPGSAASRPPAARPTPTPTTAPARPPAPAQAPAPAPVPAPAPAPVPVPVWVARSTTPPPAATPSVPPPPAAPPSSSPPVSHVEPITIRRWRRYGKDRLYANGAGGERLGYLDVATAEIVLEVADPADRIATQLQASHRALAEPPAGEQPGDGRRDAPR